MAWLRLELVAETFEEDALKRVKASRTYRAKADGPFALEDLLTAAIAGGVAVPPNADPWSLARPNCVVTRRVPRRLASRVGEVECQYEDLTAGEATVDDLLAKPARLVKLSVESEMQEYTRDAEDNWVTNGVNEPFDKSPERRRSDAVFHCEKYVSKAQMATYLALHERNNDAPVTVSGFTIPEDHGLLLVEDFQPVGPLLVPVAYLMTYTVNYRTDGWVDKVVDMGFRELNPDYDGSGEIDVYRDIVRGGGPVTKPWPLGADGSALPEDYDPTTDLNVLEFYPYKQASWAGVALPS